MGKIEEIEPGAANARGALMEGGELAGKLERIFQLFAREQEAWAQEHDPGQTASLMAKSADTPA